MGIEDTLEIGRIVQLENGQSSIRLRRDFYELLAGLADRFADEDEEADIEDGTITAEVLTPFLQNALREVGILGGLTEPQAYDLVGMYVDLCLNDERLHEELSAHRFTEVLEASLFALDLELPLPENVGQSILDSLASQRFFQLLG